MADFPEFVKVRTKKGKEINLFVGLYYTISVKSIPNCYVTYETEPREDTNLMQIAFHDTEDYEPEGVCRNHTLWTILPADSGENDYFLKVLSLPEGVLTYSHSLSWGGRYLELDLTHPEYYRPGATMHTSSLWHFEPTELPEYFTLHNSDDRRNLNFVTFSNEPSSQGQLMQIGTKDIHYYQPRGQFRNDALWNFRPANFALSLKVCDFDYELSSAEDFKTCSIPIRVTDGITVLNDTDKPHVEINEDLKLNESFVVNFLQSFKMFQEENVTVECDILMRIMQLMGDSSLLPDSNSMKFSKLTNTQWGSDEERVFPINKKVLLDPMGSATVTGFCNWVYNAEIPFSAILEVRVKSDVAICPTPVQLNCINTEIEDTSIIEYLLKYERFTGKVLPAQKCKNKSSEKDLIKCQVNGRIKASFGLDTKLEVKYL